MHSALALQKVVYDTLVSASEVTDALGGERVFDNVPAGQVPPYIVFTEATHSDWSTSTENGMEHLLTLSIWSSQSGRKQVLSLAQLCTNVLGQLDDTLAGHALINFTHQFTEVDRDKKSDLFRAKLHFRAVTEPFHQ